MKQIKFRAWYRDDREWVYAGKRNGKRSLPLEVSTPTSLYLDENEVYENEVWGLDDTEIDWCQFTGLKDKSGIEIYEGDIVYIKGSGLRRKHKEVVIFKDGCFGTKNAFDSLLFCEVIGNIYENRELLKARDAS